MHSILLRRALQRSFPLFNDAKRRNFLKCFSSVPLGVSPQNDTTAVQYVSFYKYVPLADLSMLRQRLLSEWNSLGVLGRVYIAHEGINAQISVPVNQYPNLSSQLSSFTSNGSVPFSDIFFNEGDIISPMDDVQPFEKLHIRIRPKIVQDGLSEELDMDLRGKELSPKEWHEALKGSCSEDEPCNDTERIILDCRNYYEYDIGRFDEAELVDVDRFQDTFEFLDERLENEDKQKPTFIYCTGGIRCEKVGAYLTSKGFSNVNRLKGGIVHYMKYLNEHRDVRSKFLGKNFVFDDRLAKNSSQKVTEDVLSICSVCGTPCNTHANCSNIMCGGLILQCKACAAKLDGACSTRCQEETRRMRTMNDDCRREYTKRNYTKFKLHCPNSMYRDLENKIYSIRPRIDTDRNFSTFPNQTSFFDGGLKNSDREIYAAKCSTVSENEELLQHVRDVTFVKWSRPNMMVAESQGNFLRFLLEVGQFKNVLEIGCFTGYSALKMVDGLRRDGSILTCDVDPNCINTARSFFDRHPKGSQIETVAMDGLELLKQMKESSRQFSFIFLDANKKKYREYYDFIWEQELMEDGGVLAVDNTLWKDQAMLVEKRKPGEGDSFAKALAEFNEYVKADPRTRVSMIPAWDGLTLIQRA